MSDTAIEWTDTTWNPTTGCDRVSPGCDNCYALTLAKRLKAMGNAKYQRDGDPRTSGPGFGLTTHETALTAPLGWRKPRKVFVNSMSDLFHRDVPDDFLARVFAVMSLAPQHTFQVLTKRHARLRSLVGSADFEPYVRDHARAMKYSSARSDPRMDDRNYQTWPLPNVWLGVSVEDQHWADIRIPALLDTPAAVHFLSCEPLLGPIDFGWCPTCGGSGSVSTEAQLGGVPAQESDCPDCHGIQADEGVDWVIAGGESGPGARPMNPVWVRSLRDQCTAARVPFLFKQWGGRTPKAGGRELDGRTWDEYPV